VESFPYGRKKEASSNHEAILQAYTCTTGEPRVVFKKKIQRQYQKSIQELV